MHKMFPFVSGSQAKSAIYKLWRKNLLNLFFRQGYKQAFKLREHIAFGLYGQPASERTIVVQYAFAVCTDMDWFRAKDIT